MAGIRSAGGHLRTSKRPRTGGKAESRSLRRGVKAGVLVALTVLGAAALGGESTSTSFGALSRDGRRALVFALQEQAGPARADLAERFERELPEVKDRVDVLADLARRIAAGRRFNPNPAELAAEVTPPRLPRMDSGDPDPDRTRELLAGIPAEATELSEAAELSPELLP